MELGDELTGGDYFIKPLADLHLHPDFSLEAYMFVVQISKMTSAQLEALKSHKETITNG